MKQINYTGSSKLISRIVGLLNHKAPMPLDGNGDNDWGTNGQVLTTDGNGNTSWTTPQGGGGDVTDVEVNGTSVVDAQGVANITLGTAAAKDYTTAVTQSNSDLVTSGAVWSAIDNLPEPMIFKGTLGTGGTISTLPAASSANEGFTYKVITDGTYASQSAKVGDVFTSNGSEWVLIPAGDEYFTDTWRNIKVNGTEKLGSGINTGGVDFVDGDGVNVKFDANGNKVGFDLAYLTVQNGAVCLVYES